MKRSLLLFAVVPVSLLAACGDPTTSSSPSTSVVVPPSTTGGGGTSAEIPHPTGADDVVLRVAYVGGFVPAGVAFANLPSLLITGDGRVLEQGAVAAIYPGPLMSPLLERTLTPEGIQKVLQEAQRLGLLAAPPDYSAEQNIADVPDTVVTIAAAGGTFVHTAPALGMDDTELTPARQALFDFVRATGDLPALVGADLGSDEPFTPETVRLQATPIDRSTVTTDVPPTFVDWPAGADVSLAAAASCAVTATSAVIQALDDATTITFFVEDGVTYSVVAAPVLPGDAATSLSTDAPC